MFANTALHGHWFLDPLELGLKVNMHRPVTAFNQTKSVRCIVYESPYEVIILAKTKPNRLRALPIRCSSVIKRLLWCLSRACDPISNVNNAHINECHVVKRSTLTK